MDYGKERNNKLSPGEDGDDAGREEVESADRDWDDIVACAPAGVGGG